MSTAFPRVVITGFGVVSPIGCTADSFWENLRSGRSGIDKISAFDASAFSTQIAGEARDFQVESFMDRKEAKRTDRVIQLGVAAAKMAIQHSGLDLDSCDRDRVGVMIGTGIGGMATWEEQHSILIEKGPRRISPFFIPMMIPNMPAGQVSIMLDLRGPSFSVVSACATGGNCIGSAYDAIRLGQAEVMLAGGTEAAVTPLGIGGFCAMRAMSTRNDDPSKASRPFDSGRDGFVMGEGAGVVVLESLEYAQKRGATVLCELLGYACSSDAYHMTNPDPEGKGAARAMKIALANCGKTPDDVDYINAHGTSTPVGDPCEIKAMRSVFGDGVARVAVSSSKSMTGHTLGAAGAIETIVCTLTLQNQIITPTINLQELDPECAVDVVPNVARAQKVNFCLNNTFGFGGHNVVLGLGRWSEA
jgi:3-oxoacyl-[acyl-carrier-protein] synthase II